MQLPKQLVKIKFFYDSLSLSLPLLPVCARACVCVYALYNFLTYSANLYFYLTKNLILSNDLSIRLFTAESDSISWKVNSNTRFFSNTYLTFDIRAMTLRFGSTWAKFFSMLSRIRVRTTESENTCKWKEKKRAKEKEQKNTRGMWVDNEKCSCHLLEQTSASKDFKITFTRADSAGGRSHSAWKFHFHNLQGGSLSPDVSREYILCYFPKHEMENAVGRRQIFITLSSVFVRDFTQKNGFRFNI